ncbi:Fic family protein [Bacillus sp. NP157]|nr:Fic family protein [Bacillus sp. NP157]
MNTFPVDGIGAAWLARTYQVAPLARLPVVSQVGTRRATETTDGFRLETYVESMRPPDEPAAHLQFHLRHEVPHLEFLARLFQATGPSMVQSWVDAEATGQYARRAAFLYEWLTGESLQVPARLGGNYVDALDAAKLVTASPDRIRKVARWRINDNLPGTPFFSPTIVKTDATVQAAQLDIAGLLGQLTAEFGEDLLMRAASWLTLRESKASFAIEGEADQSSRVQRFADVMARRTGEGEVPLSEARLAELQGDILGDRTTVTRLGLRQSPVFVGETFRFEEVVHYVAPPASDLGSMLAGLSEFLHRTEGQSPVMRSAVTAFGFVYIHPLADGNGRVHRFLINDVLRRDGVVPPPVILPVSAAITDDSAERKAYDGALDTVSRPLMEAVRRNVSFEDHQHMYPDGVVSNFRFSGDAIARPAWRFPDLGAHVRFLSGILRRTITEQMHDESLYLRRHGRARVAIKQVVEMPDAQADRILRSIEQNKGQLSNVLAKEMPLLKTAGVWDALVDAVTSALDGDS